MGESFWQKNSLITQILFELWLANYSTGVCHRFFETDDKVDFDLIQILKNQHLLVVDTREYVRWIKCSK